MLQRACPQLKGVENSHAMHAQSRLWTHSPEVFYGQFCHKVQRFIRVNGAYSVGFSIVRSYLCQELIIRNTSRSRKIQLVFYALFDFLCYVYSEWNAFLVCGNIKESLVKGYGFDEFCVVMKDAMYLCRHLFIMLITSFYDNKVLA